MDDLGRFKIGAEIDVSGVEAGMNQAISILNNSVNAMKASFEGIQGFSVSSMSNAANSVVDSERKIELSTEQMASKIKSETDNVKNSFGSIHSSAGSAGTAISGINQSTYSLGSSLNIFDTMKSKLIGLAVGAVGVGTAFATIKEGINFDSKIQQATISFTTMLGSAEAATDMIEKLKKFAADTPFEFPDLQNAAKRMLAFGFAANDILPMLKSVGDAASGLGMSGKEGVDRIVLALGQMKAKAKVSGDEMLQLTEAGIPAWDILAQSMGKTTAEVMKLGEKGAIPADKAIQALIAGMEQRFPNMMDKQSASFEGMMSTIKDNFEFVIGDIVQPGFDYLAQNVLPKVTSSMDNFSNAMKSGGLSAAFKTIFSPVLVNGFVGAVKMAYGGLQILLSVVSALSPVIMGLGVAYGAVKAAQMASALWTGLQTIAYSVQTGTVALTAAGTWAFSAANDAATLSAIATTAATEGLSAAFTALTAVMAINPIILAISLALAGLALAAYEVTTHWEGFKESAINIWNAVVDFVAEHIAAIIALFPGLGAGIYLIYNYWTPAMEMIKKLWNMLTDFIGDCGNKLSEIWNQICDGFNGFVDRIGDGISDLKNEFSDIVTSFLPSWANDFLGILTDMGNKAVTKSAEIGSAIRNNLSIKPAGGSAADLKRSEDTNTLPPVQTFDSSTPTVDSGVDWSGIGDGTGGKTKKDKTAKEHKDKEKTEYEQKKEEYEYAVTQAKLEAVSSGKNFNYNDQLYLYQGYLANVKKLDDDKHHETLDYAKKETDLIRENLDEQLKLKIANFQREEALKSIVPGDIDKSKEIVHKREGEITKKVDDGQDLSSQELKIYEKMQESKNASAGSSTKINADKDEYSLMADENKKMMDENAKIMKSAGQTQIEAQTAVYEELNAKGLISNQQLIQNKISALNQSFALTKANLEKEAALQKLTYADLEKAYKNFCNAKTDAERQQIMESAILNAKDKEQALKLWAEMQTAFQNNTKQQIALDKQQTEERLKNVTKLVDAVSSGLGQMTKNLVTHAKGWKASLVALRTSISSVLAGMVQDWVTSRVKMYINSLIYKEKEVKAVKAAKTQEGALGKAGATDAATSSATAAESTISSIESVMSYLLIAYALYSAIFGSSSDSTSDTYSPSSNYRQTGTVYSSLPSYDVGTLEVAKDQVAQIHAGETIIPKSFASGARDFIANGGFNQQNNNNTSSQRVSHNISSNQNINVSALDGSGVKKALSNNATETKQGLYKADRSLSMANQSRWGRP